jgi:hypothetical protein
MAVLDEAPPAHATLADAKPVHARWSEANREFLEFVERNPECLERAAFASVNAEPSLRSLTIQPWPFFVDAGRRRELETVAVGIDRLVKGVMERFLGNDPEKIAAFYHKDAPEGRSPDFELSEDLVAFLLEEPSGVEGAPSRADYIDTREGLRCLEYNAGSCLGGMHAGVVGGLHLAAAPVARFLAERGRAARPPEVLKSFFAHVVEDTVRQGVWDGGDFNVAMVVRPHNEAYIARHSAEGYTRELRAALAENGPAAGGRVLLCAVDEFADDGERLTLRGLPVHAIVEQHDGDSDIRHLYRAFKRGMANLFSGPVGELLSDKRNLALISENAGSDELTAAERALVERHLPWTRRVLPGLTTFRGRGFRLPDDLLERRADLVLKKASSVGGTFVEVGRYRTDAQWRDAVARAARERDWVVQEYQETVPYCFQSGDAGAELHELVWGLFVFGRRFGGVFLRMDPMGRAGGVVNTRRGSEVGTALEIVE